MFCKHCGKQTEEDVKFCKHCGGTIGESSPAVKEEPKSEKPAQTSVAHKEPPVAVQIIKACIQIVILVLVLYWAWYMYNCAVGNNAGNGDQMCQSFSQMFSGGNIPDPGPNPNPGSACVSTGCGNQWYCNGTYYVDGSQKRINGCVSTNPGTVYSSWSGNCRKCP